MTLVCVAWPQLQLPVMSVSFDLESFFDEQARENGGGSESSAVTYAYGAGYAEIFQANVFVRK